MDRRGFFKGLIAGGSAAIVTRLSPEPPRSELDDMEIVVSINDQGRSRVHVKKKTEED